MWRRFAAFLRRICRCPSGQNFTLEPYALRQKENRIMRIPRLALGLTLAFVLGACSGLYDVYRGSEPVQAALFAGDKLYLLTAKGDYEFSGIGTANLERFVRSPFSAKTTLSEWSLAAGRKTADESSYSVYIVPQDVSEKERQELLKTHSFELVEAAALKADVKKSIAAARPQWPQQKVYARHFVSEGHAVRISGREALAAKYALNPPARIGLVLSADRATPAPEATPAVKPGRTGCVMQPQYGWRC